MKKLKNKFDDYTKMKKEDMEFLERRVAEAAHLLWVQSKDYLKLIDIRNRAMREKKHLIVAQCSAAIKKGEDDAKDKMMDNVMKAIETVQRVKDGLPDEKVMKLDRICIMSFLLMDMLDGMLIEIKDMTRAFEQGSYNPFCPDILKDCIKEVRGQLAFIYKDGDRDLIEEFVKSSDRLAPLVENHAKSILRKVQARKEAAIS